MADYYPLISRAVAALEKNSGENRRAIYVRARAGLLAQLRGVTPPLDESDITRERLALEESIRKVEAESARRFVETARQKRGPLAELESLLRDNPFAEFSRRARTETDKEKKAKQREEERQRRQEEEAKQHEQKRQCRQEEEAKQREEERQRLERRGQFEAHRARLADVASPAPSLAPALVMVCLTRLRSPCFHRRASAHRVLRDLGREGNAS